MSLRRKLLEIKANWEKWEDRLAIAAEGLFAAAVAANVGRFFSVRKDPSLLGAVCSWLYLITWVLAAILLRNRTKWIRTVLIVRWTGVAAVLLAFAASASGSVNSFSSVCVIPYAAFISAYSGLSQEAWLYYLLLFAQALAASGLSRRLRRRQKNKKQAPQ